MARLQHEEFLSTLDQMKNEYMASDEKERLTYVFMSEIEQDRIIKMIDKTEIDLDTSMNRNCYNASKLRFHYKTEKILGEAYTGFSKSDFQTIEKIMEAPKIGLLAG